MKQYMQQQLISYLIKKKPSQDEEEITKHVVEVYVKKLMAETFEKHMKGQAWGKIIQNTKRFCTGLRYRRRKAQKS